MNNSNTNPLKGTWGFICSEEDVLREDRDRFSANRLLGATMICIEELDKSIVLQYKSEVFHVKKNKFITRLSPMFVWGDIVLMKDKMKEAVVKSICWHYKEERYFYMLKDVKKRYYSEQLVLLRHGDKGDKNE